MVFTQTTHLLPHLLLLSLVSASASGVVHVIRDAEGLIELSNIVNSNISDYSGTTVLLESDITFTKALSEQFNPIGKGGSKGYFRSTFDGQGHVIKNLEIFSSMKAIGLFGLTQSATIRNVVLDSSCSINGTFNGNGGKKDYYTAFGGIVGFCGSGGNGSCIVENNVNMAPLTYVDSGKMPQLIFLGGIVGDYEPDAYDVYVRNCANYGTISQEGSYIYASIGGIAGTCTADGATKKRYFQNCVNYGAIIHNGTANNIYEARGYGGIGGILAMSQDINVIENCLSAGTITAVSYIKYIGTIVGEGSGTANYISNCLWTNEVGEYSACGYGDTTNVINTARVDLTAAIVSDMSLRAAKNNWNGWFYNQYSSTITFNFNGGNVSFNSQVILLPDLAAENDEEVFRGWFTERTCENLFETQLFDDVDMVLYGGWAYNVTFDYENTTRETKPVIYKQFYGDLPVPEKTGYSFDGWFTDNTYVDKITRESVVSIAGAHALCPKWIINQYTITFEVDGGSECENITQDYNTEVVLPEPTKTGYTFDCWCSDPELSREYTETTMPSENVTLYAKWSINQYNLTFVFNNGDENEVRTLDFNSKIVYPENLEKTGYTFSGWDNKPDRMPSENIIITAIWIPRNYTITFNAAGGVVAQPTKPVTYKQTYGDLPEPTRTGYTFAGWFTDSSYTSEVTSESIVSVPNDHVLYAYWTSAFVEIVFGSKDMKESDITNSIKAYIGGEFVIKRIETDPSGETRVIVKFMDEKEAIHFVRGITAMSGSGTILFRVVGFSNFDESSYSMAMTPFYSLIFLFFASL